MHSSTNSLLTQTRFALFVLKGLITSYLIPQVVPVKRLSANIPKRVNGWLCLTDCALHFLADPLAVSLASLLLPSFGFVSLDCDSDCLVSLADGLDIAGLGPL